MSKKKDFVIALGGSIVVPKDINIDFLKKFHFLIKEKIKDGFRFVVIVGGGGITRTYQNAVSKIINVGSEDKDWIGIHATRLNAHLVRTLFKKEVHPIVFDNRFVVKSFEEYSLIIGAGWKPGWSTDFVACQIACDFNMEEVIILGKPDHVYTADFEKDKNAKPFEKISWKDYLELIPTEWSPGLSSPVDPVAARLAQKENLKIIVAEGKNLDNFQQILSGNKFKGTIIDNF